MLFIIICLFINSSQIVHMYMHPAVRNIKRRGMDPQEKEKENKWMVDKVLLLRELCEVYKDHSHPNKDINKILTNKIIYQIKYHRRKLKLVGEEVTLKRSPWQQRKSAVPLVQARCSRMCLESTGVITKSQSKNGVSC